MLPFEPRLMTWGVLGTLGGVSLVFLACAYLLFSDPESDPVPEEARPDRAAIRRELEQSARERLESYGWVDEENGIVRIPVERARALAGGEEGKVTASPSPRPIPTDREAS